jgi:hypothetical protein
MSLKNKNYNRKIKRKNYLLKHSRKLHERNIRYKKIKKRYNKLKYTNSDQKLKNKASEEGFKIITAPIDFSLINNTEETLQFIQKIENCFEKAKKVFVDIRLVNKISTDAIVVLLSILTKFKTNKIGFNGNFPKNNQVKKDLISSGFFYHLMLKDFLPKDSYSFEKEIYTNASKKVNPELADKLIKKATEFIWGREKACRGVQRIFLELMQNTNNHASEKQGEQYWWTTLKCSKTEKKAMFSFIDYGMGIFKSLERKSKNNKFAKAMEHILKSIKSNKNDELLKDLLEGNIHKIAKIPYYRGKGLHGIWSACNDNAVSNLIIISDDVIANYATNTFQKIESKLMGTFIYWELNENNINKEYVSNE